MTRCLHHLWSGALVLRDTTAGKPGPILEAHVKPGPNSLRVGILLAVIGILNLLDLTYTIFAHRVGVLKEMNPIAANLLQLDVETSLVCFKLLTMLLGSFILWKARRSPWAPGACWLLVIVYTALAITWIAWMQVFLSVQSLPTDWASPISLARPLVARF